ncbi:hypothetical protein ACIQZG_22650 [Lysinibacillus sp. NPDC096418]|uniref:hypothetical protein n=1 Tax=Lysinibacillus sp. NPDC096418 TaxID=3364138 RepID=UPI0038011E51
MFKIFLVGKGTILEREINKLMLTGVFYIPTFEKKVGIKEFCSDMKVLYNSNDDTNLFFIISGPRKGITLDSCFNEENVKEITLEKLKFMVSNGYSLRSAIPTKTFQHISYKLELKFPDFRRWKITST